MARSVFYYHLKRLKACDKYAVEKECIKSVFHEHKGRYGYRRVTAEMRNRGFAINHKTVQRLMGEMCLKSKIRKIRYRSYKGVVGKIASNIIARDFSADAPNRKWATDVTQINIGSVKLYLLNCTPKVGHKTFGVQFKKGGTLYPLNGKFLLESSAKCRIFAECVKLVTFKLFLCIL